MANESVLGLSMPEGDEAGLDKMRLSRAGFIRLCMKALDEVDLKLLESAAETYLAAQRVEKDTADEFWNDVALRVDHATRVVVPPLYVIMLCCVFAVSPHEESGPDLLHWELERPGLLYVAVIFGVCYVGALFLLHAAQRRLVASRNLRVAPPQPRPSSSPTPSSPAQVQPKRSPDNLNAVEA